MALVFNFNLLKLLLFEIIEFRFQFNHIIFNIVLFFHDKLMTIILYSKRQQSVFYFGTSITTQ